MKRNDFERILDVCCGALTLEARKHGFRNSQVFENRVRQTLDELLQDERSMRVDFSPPPQEFPDIVLGEFGVEVKFTLSDTWKSIANSIQESQRASKLLESNLEKAAKELEDGLFVEYWGESVTPNLRIQKWLEKADKIAVGWRPSEVLFCGRYALQKKKGGGHA